MSTYKHWVLTVDASNMAWLTFDRADSKVNSLNREVFAEFKSALDDILAKQPAGVVLRSGKTTGFIAGADITQFTELKTSDEAFELIRESQLILDKLEALPMPTVALIDGFCLGGGCEVSLACTYRIAIDSPSTRIGLPEVKLGIIPGWGGTVRLPKLIGAPAAMSIMLAGAVVDAKKAKKIGIADAVVPGRDAERAAMAFLTKKPAPHKPKGIMRFSNEAWVRPWLGRIIEKQLRKKANADHYPAPFAILEKWIQEGVTDHSYIAEARTIARLMVTENSRNMVRDFFLQTELKAQGKVAKNTVQHVHVVGAGTMGGDIAAWCAYKGFRVTLQDQSAERIAPAIKRAYALYKKKLKKPRLIQAVMDRLEPDTTGAGALKADLIIEAIFEDLKVKQALFKQLESQAKPTAILASNTSSIPLDEINAVLTNPERLVGIHFFNPVAKMPLVEVVYGKQSDPEYVKAAQAFVGKLSKLPLPVKSSPGFLVNRALMPYLIEAVTLLEEGYSAAEIDSAALEFGMPMGPIRLADTVGLDVCLHVAKNLVAHYGGAVPEKLHKMVESGYLGVKTDRGFYSYTNGKSNAEDTINLNKAKQELLSSRLIDRMLNECVACLHEGVVGSADLLDAGMIFGTGFAPFRGGPLHYAKSKGVDMVVAELERFAGEYGERFKPSIGWSDLKANDSCPSQGKASTGGGSRPPSSVQHDAA